MAKSKYELAGAFHSRVYRCNMSGQYFILVPDVAGGEPGRFDAQVHQVSHDPRSNPHETYQVFRRGRRREDLEVGLRIVGQPWGTHTILEPNAALSWEAIDSFRTQFEGTGCILFLVSVPLVSSGFFYVAAQLIS